jgi:hypothetical protein
VTLRDRSRIVDLSGAAKIRWRSYQAGFRELRIVLKLANGSWLVSDEADAAAPTWRERKFKIAELHWHTLDIDKVVEGTPVDRPDLTQVDEIGFTDLMTGGGSNACSRLDGIEVYGRPLPRPSGVSR